MTNQSNWERNMEESDILKILRRNTVMAKDRDQIISFNYQQAEKELQALLDDGWVRKEDIELDWRKINTIIDKVLIEYDCLNKLPKIGITTLQLALSNALTNAGERIVK